MREPRRSPPALRLVLSGLLVAALPLAAAACSGGGAGYPDRDAITAAQVEWCTALGKIDGAGEKWSAMSDCKSAYPTASAAFLRGTAAAVLGRSLSISNGVRRRRRVGADA